MGLHPQGFPSVHASAIPGRDIFLGFIIDYSEEVNPVLSWFAETKACISERWGKNERNGASVESPWFL